MATSRQTASQSARRRDDADSLAVCIAIPTYNRERVLVDTIEQVLALAPAADEVLVIDQTPAHETETEAYLRARHEAGQLRWIVQEAPNLPAARNRAIKETRCDILIYIDDDVELPADFVAAHRRNYTDSRVAAVAGRVVQPGLTFPKRSVWPRLMDHRFFRLDSAERREGIATFRGCNHSLRVVSLASIGGYDTNYIGWAYREEGDVALRLYKAGELIVFDPDAWLKHLATPSGGCRLQRDHKPLPEWQVSFPATYFAMRHLFPNRWFWSDVLLENVRRYVLRRRNIVRPWRLLWAGLSYLYAVFRAAQVCMMSSPNGPSALACAQEQNQGM